MKRPLLLVFALATALVACQPPQKKTEKKRTRINSLD